ncbi:MAG: TOBE domain-containing protein, partial [Phyllobacterium sp.]
AQFIGSPTMNFLPARIGKDGCVELLGQRLPIRTGLEANAPASIGIRPESIAPTGPSGVRDGQAGLNAVLRRKENLGSEYILHFDVAGLGSSTVTSRVPSDRFNPDSGAFSELAFDVAACHVFDGNGDRVEPLDAQGRTNDAPIRLFLTKGAAG